MSCLMPSLAQARPEHQPSTESESRAGGIQSESPPSSIAHLFTPYRFATPPCPFIRNRYQSGVGIRPPWSHAAVRLSARQRISGRGSPQASAVLLELTGMGIRPRLCPVTRRGDSTLEVVRDGAQGAGGDEVTASLAVCSSRLVGPRRHATRA